MVKLECIDEAFMYEMLLYEAEKKYLDVIYLPLQEKTKGLYYDGAIAINKNILTTSERTCVLAEELGHYYTSCGNIIDQKITVNRKQEIKAKRWALKRLVSLKNIIKAYETGCRNMYEIAGYMGVTEEFLRDAFDTYCAMFGKFKRFGKYTIYFDPPGVCKE